MGVHGFGVLYTFSSGSRQPTCAQITNQVELDCSLRSDAVLNLQMHCHDPYFQDSVCTSFLLVTYKAGIPQSRCHDVHANLVGEALLLY